MASNFEFTATKNYGIANMQIDGSTNFALNFLKDICIHLRRLKKDELSFQEEPNGFFTFKWHFDIDNEDYLAKLNILKYDYQEVPFAKFKSILLDICNNFDIYFSFLRPSLSAAPFKTYFVDVTNVVTERNYMRLPKTVQHNDFNDILHEMMQNCFTDATVTLLSNGFSFDEMKAALDLPVKQLMLYNSSKKPLIDFSTLTFNGNLRYDYI